MDNHLYFLPNKKVETNSLERTFSKRNVVDIESDEEESETIDVNNLDKTFDPKNETISLSPKSNEKGTFFS